MEFIIFYPVKEEFETQDSHDCVNPFFFKFFCEGGRNWFITYNSLPPTPQ